MENFSAKRRNQLIGSLKGQQFDIIVVGGGITGAGIALDASMRGFKVLLVEKNDFAWGTSSRSTKLIHGGLRYLKQLEISLVREVGLERSIVYRNALHLVRPKRMLLPIVESGSIGKTMSSLGLWVYDFLAGVQNQEKRKMLDVAETLQAEPLLKEEDLLGSGLYYEYRTDDARLTIEILKKAVEFGATAINYLKAEKPLFENEQINGIRLKDQMTLSTLELKAKYIVNAAGPWVDEFRTADLDKNKDKSILLSKGVHIVVSRSKLPINQAVYFDVRSDDRMIFAIPRGSVCYIGTTDTVFKGNIDQPNCSKEDVDYLLQAVNDRFKNIHLEIGDIISSWAGLRPLIYEEGKDSSEISRRDEIFTSSSGMLSIAGGKLTGYRKMAERIVDRIVKEERKRKSTISYDVCKTEKQKIGGADFENYEDLKQYRRKLHLNYKSTGADYEKIKSLVFKYGSNTEILLDRLESLQGLPIEKALLMAELWYNIHHEMCLRLSDYFIRRTGMLYFDRLSIPDQLPIIADEMASILSWDENVKRGEINTFNKSFNKAVEFLSH